MADPSQDAEGSSNYRSTWDKGTLNNNCWAHRLKADPHSRPICTGTFLELLLQVFLGSCGQELVSSPCVFPLVRGYSRLPSRSATPPPSPPSEFLKSVKVSCCSGLFSSLPLMLLFKLLKHPFNFILIEF